MTVSRLIAAAALLAAAGCSGMIGDANGITPPSQATASLCNGTPSVPVSPMRRLSNLEYRHTVADLLGLPEVADLVTASFSADPESLGFRNGAEFLSMSTMVAQQYSDAADRLSAEAVARNWNTLIRCNTGESERNCAQRFVVSFGQRAYRRPLEQSEVAAVMAKSYDAARTGGYDFKTGVEWIIYGMLQSPSFLQRVELVQANGTPQRIRGYEMASRLSYLIWSSAPDDELLAAAAAGELDTEAGIALQAERLLDDDRARRLSNFFVEWLDVDRLDQMERDPAFFAGLNPYLPSLLRDETEAFVNSVMWEGDANLTTLLTAPYTYMNEALAQHYGVSGITGIAFQRVNLDPTKRAGLLMQTAVLTAHDKESRTSVVRRGLKIRTDVLCGTVGAPPDNAVLDLPPTTQGLTQRATLEQHRTNVTCNACHGMMDPIGVVFEGIDAVGRPRTKDEAGNTINTSSELTLTSVDGPVSGPVDLVQRLLTSEEVPACVTTQLFRYAYGRQEKKKVDGCSQERLLGEFTQSGYNLRTAILALTKTDAFLYRAAN